jgi:hypothetical protein
MLTNPHGKPFSRVVHADESVMAFAKYVARQNAAAVNVTAATMAVAANGLLFTVNAAAEVVIGTYTGSTAAANGINFVDANIANIRNLIDTINGLGAGMVAAGTTFNRWKAGLGDYRPGYVIGAGDGTVVAAANALLGEDHIGLPILADISNHAAANTMCVGIPLIGTARGTGGLLPSHFESDYTSTTAGVVTRNRFSQARRQEEQPTSQTMVEITGIHMGAVFANGDQVITVYDINDNVVWAYNLLALLVPPAQVLSVDNPIVGPMGSPLFVEVAGTGALTDGPLTVSGNIRVA